MRTKEEIEKEIYTQNAILETLLDIRDLLQNPPKEKNYQVKIPNRE